MSSGSCGLKMRQQGIRIGGGGPGTQSTSPGKMRFGFVMCGLAAMSACNDTPNRRAMKNMVSPRTTVYLP